MMEHTYIQVKNSDSVSNIMKQTNGMHLKFVHLFWYCI